MIKISFSTNLSMANSFLTIILPLHIPEIPISKMADKTDRITVQNLQTWAESPGTQTAQRPAFYYIFLAVETFNNVFGSSRHLGLSAK